MEATPLLSRLGKMVMPCGEVQVNLDPSGQTIKLRCQCGKAFGDVILPEGSTPIPDHKIVNLEQVLLRSHI